MVKIQGITIELNGDTTGLNDALKSVDKQTKSVQSELKQVDKLLKFDPSNIELLSQKQQLLGDAVNSTSQRLDALKQAQSEVERQFANGDIGADQYRAFQRELVATEGQLDSFRRQLANVDARLEVEADASILDRVQDELKDVANTAKKVGKEIGDGLKKGAEVGAKSIAGIGIAAAGAVAGVGAFVESQKEMSTDLARLKTNAEVAGFSLESVEEGFKKVAAVSGEADSAVEALSNLMATDMSENQLAEMLDYVNGAAIKFSDTLKTEGIADGIQETFATGEAIGPFAELLERSGVNLDVFNKGLAKASKAGTATDYVLQQLSQLGLKDTYDAYLENNSAIADYNLAQVESQKKLAEFSDVLRPFVTTLMEMGNIILDVVLGNKDLSTGFSELVTIISELGTKFMNAAKEAMPKFIEGIQSALPKVLDAGIEILSKILEGFSSKYPALMSKGIELIEKLASTLIANLPKILDTGVKVITSIVTGITNNIPKIVSTALNLVLKLVSTIITNLPKIIEAGVKILTSIVSGIGNALPQLVSFLAGTFIPNIVKIIKDADWKQIGKDIINGLIKGVSSMTKSAIEAITGVVGSVVGAAKKLLGIASPSKVFRQIGLWTGEGLAIGIDGSSKMVNEAMTNIADGILAISYNYQEEYSNMIDEFNRKNEEKNDKTLEKIYKIQNAAAKKKRKLTKQELQEIALLEAKYRDDKLQSEIDFDKKYKALVAKSEKEYLEVIKNHIANKKSLGQLSLADEARIWEQSIGLFAEGSKERLTAQKSYKDALDVVNKEIVNVNEKYMSQMQKIDDDLLKNTEALTKAYDDAVKNRKSSLMSFAGTFDEFKIEITKTGEELLANLQSQVDGFKAWQKEFAKLSNRGIDSELLDELSGLGVKALPQLMALNQLTDEQLTQYSALYREKSELARKQAEEELKGMKVDTEKQISELKNIAMVQLELLQKEWNKAIVQLTTTTSDELDTLEQIGINAGLGLFNGLSSMQSPLIKKAKEIATSISRTIQEALDIHSPSRVMKGFGINIGQGLIVGMDDMISKVAQSSNRLSNAIQNAHSSISTSTGKSQSNAVVQQRIVNQSSNIDLSSLVAAIVELASKPTEVMLNVDGRQMAHVVSQNQYNTASMSALTKGVRF